MKRPAPKGRPPKKRPTRARITTARAGAVALLDGVLGRERLLTDLTAPGGLLDTLKPADRARAGRLAAEVLRGLERIDRLLSRHVAKPPPLTFRNILRLGTWELCAGEAAHGVVNECVELAAAAPHGDQLKGLVNAVLRKFNPDVAEAFAVMRPPRLPNWLRDPLVEAWGREAIASMEAAHLAGAPLDLTMKNGPDSVPFPPELGAITLPTGTVRIPGSVQVTKLPGFAEGAFWVQDAAAALPARMLNAQPGERVLDLCAAPGGKTLQLAATGAKVTALDMSARRMLRVQENLARTGLSADCVTGDALDHHGGPYDAILLDAPCSATGTIRRHPDLPHIALDRDIAGLIELQEKLIDHALTLLAPGGRLVFCTCSLIPDEGECQVDEALKRHPGLKVDTGARAIPGVPEDWFSPEGGLRLRPDYWAETGGIDGFYLACLRR